MASHDSNAPQPAAKKSTHTQCSTLFLLHSVVLGCPFTFPLLGSLLSQGTILELPAINCSQIITRKHLLATSKKKKKALSVQALSSFPTFSSFNLSVCEFAGCCNADCRTTTAMGITHSHEVWIYSLYVTLLYPEQHHGGSGVYPVNWALWDAHTFTHSSIHSLPPCYPCIGQHYSKRWKLKVLKFT